LLSFNLLARFLTLILAHTLQELRLSTALDGPTALDGLYIHTYTYTYTYIYTYTYTYIYIYILSFRLNLKSIEIHVSEFSQNLRVNGSYFLEISAADKLLPSDVEVRKPLLV